MTLLIAQLYQRRAQVATHRTALEQMVGALDDEKSKASVELAMATAELAWLDSTLKRLSQQPLFMEVVESN